MSEVQNSRLKSVVFCPSLKPKSSYNAKNSKSEVESLKSEVESLSEFHSKSEFRNLPSIMSEVICPKSVWSLTSEDQTLKSKIATKMAEKKHKQKKAINLS